MLAGRDLVIRGFYRSSEASFHCRACTVKELGEATVARLEVGLCAGVGDEWDVANRYEIDESAIENGYHCEEADHKKAKSGYFECGARLDTPEDEESAA